MKIDLKQIGKDYKHWIYIILAGAIFFCGFGFTKNKDGFSCNKTEPKFDKILKKADK